MNNFIDVITELTLKRAFLCVYTQVWTRLSQHLNPKSLHLHVIKIFLQICLSTFPFPSFFQAIYFIAILPFTANYKEAEFMLKASSRNNKRTHRYWQYNWLVKIHYFLLFSSLLMGNLAIQQALGERTKASAFALWKFE